MPSVSVTPPAPPAADDTPPEREYDSEGLYLWGPKRARPITARLAELTVARCSDPAPPPVVARAQAEIKRTRARASLTRRERMAAAVLGWPVGRASQARAA